MRAAVRLEPMNLFLPRHSTSRMTDHHRWTRRQLMLALGAATTLPAAAQFRVEISGVAADFTVVPHVTIGGSLVLAFGLGGSQKTENP